MTASEAFRATFGTVFARWRSRIDAAARDPAALAVAVRGFVVELAAELGAAAGGARVERHAEILRTCILGARVGLPLGTARWRAEVAAAAAAAFRARVAELRQAPRGRV